MTEPIRTDAQPQDAKRMTGQEQILFDKLLLHKYSEVLRSMQLARRAYYKVYVELLESQEECKLADIALTYAEKTYFPRLEEEY